MLGASTWAVLALTCDIELFSQAHYRSSIDPDRDLDPLWKDVFLFHWREESQHAILDEMEWLRENDKLDAAARDQAVDDLIGLVGAVDGICQLQAKADCGLLRRRAPAARSTPTGSAGDRRRRCSPRYRWQYIASGVQDAALPRAARIDDRRRARARASTPRLHRSSAPASQ